MKKILIILICLFSLVLCGCDRVNNTSENSPVISREQAMDIAVEQVDDATRDNICEFCVDVENGHASYKGKMLDGAREYDFVIDAASGDITSWQWK